ncbi:hypothetical protein HG530_011565 [Fusarium avenaceum]|nr:hypothetical protein HG530_011565 [Fusarium avenaceum]
MQEIETKASGACKINTNGCISNSGNDIVNNESLPEEFKRIGYFLSYKLRRACLHMDASEIEDNFKEAEDISEKFDIFDKMDAPFKIFSFGGWAESTNAATFQRDRHVVKPKYRFVFTTNISKFLETRKSFDGVREHEGDQEDWRSHGEDFNVEPGFQHLDHRFRCGSLHQSGRPSD